MTKEHIDTSSYVPFGSSSLFFLVPFLYTVLYSDPTCKQSALFVLWKYGLLFLTVMSFSCNYFTEIPQFVLCDYTIIIGLTIIYFLSFSRYTIPILLCLIYFVELMTTHGVSTTVLLSFFALNLFAFTNFTRTELITGIVAFCIGIGVKLCRNNRCTNTYPFYTTIWHVCCATLLVLASRSLMRHQIFTTKKGWYPVYICNY